MKILNRFTNETIIEANTIKECIEKSGKNLGGADLRGADLRDADLRGADLRGADLRGADLGGADLRYACLGGAKILWQPDLSILVGIKGKLTCWKYVINGKSPYQKAEYDVGKTYIEQEVLRDKWECCGPGLNVATLLWCYHDSREHHGNTGLRFLKCETEIALEEDIVVPIHTDGKFRVTNLTVISEHTREEVEEMLKL